MPRLDTVHVHLCNSHPDNPRESFDNEDLIASIREHGVLTPAVVWGQSTGEYLVLAGHRRIHALRQLEKPFVPALIFDGHELNDEKAQFFLLEENIKHKTLEPVEEARAIASRMKKFGLTQGQLAQEYRRSQGWVSQRLSLLPVEKRPEPKVSGRPRNEAPGLIKPLISPSSPVSTSNAVRSAPVEAQPAVARAVEQQKLSSVETNSLVKAVKEAPPERQKEVAEKAAESPDPISTARELSREASIEAEKKMVAERAIPPHLTWTGSTADTGAHFATKTSLKILKLFIHIEERNPPRYDICPDIRTLERSESSFLRMVDWATNHLNLVREELRKRQSAKRATVTHLRPVGDSGE